MDTSAVVRVGSRLLALLAALGMLVAVANPAAGTTTSTSTVGGAALATAGTVVAAPGAAPLPQVSAAAYVLADLRTGEVLAAKDAHGRWRPASTLKVLTALALLPRLDPAAGYTATPADANVQGSRVGVVPGATYTVHQLFQALLLVSANDAARALANAAGGVQQTVAAMNRTARDLGARDTTVRNPSGLDAPGQLTSAYDLAVIARAAMARADFRAYVGTVKAQFPGGLPRAGSTRRSYEIYTQDRLLLHYRGAIGVKAGWTTKARGTFVGAATRGGRTLVVTVLRSGPASWQDAAALLSWGFRAGSLARPVGTLAAVAQPRDGAGAGRPGVGPAALAAAGSGSGLAWWGQALLALTGLVVLLRGRVLLRRRLRRSRRMRRPGLAPARRPGPAHLPQTRDRRRDTTPARAAPAAAPSSVPRTVLVRRPGDAPAAGAPTGTGP